MILNRDMETGLLDFRKHSVSSTVFVTWQCLQKIKNSTTYWNRTAVLLVMITLLANHEYELYLCVIPVSRVLQSSTAWLQTTAVCSPSTACRTRACYIVTYSVFILSSFRFALHWPQEDDWPPVEVKHLDLSSYNGTCYALR